MEKLAIFRDRQEVQSSDLNNVQFYARAAIDRVVREGLTDEKKFTGFTVTKTAATSVSISVGAFWANGQVFIREVAHTIDFLSQLPLTTKKIAAITVGSSEIETNVEARDFLTDVDTGATEPESVAMQSLRYAAIGVVYGNENAAPQKPTVSTDVLVIAWVTLGTGGVELIERAVANELMSAKKLDQRATELESWRKTAGEKINTLGTDMANLANQLKGRADQKIVYQIAEDVSLIKEQLEVEDSYTSYGADRFLDERYSDTDEVTYHAKVEEGLRFPDANASSVAVSLFNPLEPNVKVHSSGIVLPKYNEVTRLVVTGRSDQLSLSQYQYQTVTWQLKSMSAMRLRFGRSFTVCSNSAWWSSGTYDYASGTFTQIDGRTYQILEGGLVNNGVWTGYQNLGPGSHNIVRVQEFWYDQESEYYQDRVVTDHAVSGAIVGQTFPNSQNGWLTSIDLAFTQVGATGDVYVIVCETENGRVDTSKGLTVTQVPVADLVQGGSFASIAEWTRVPITPTALEIGKQYAVVLMTGGNHYVGLADGSAFGGGTLQYSTDGVFFQGDLERNMMMRLNFAEFPLSRIEVELGSLSLSGGIDDLDLAAETVAPEGTSLTFEVRPDGSSTWYSLANSNTDPFQGLPVLCHFRAVYSGSKDVMPGVNLINSKVKVSRPDTALKHYTETIDFALATQSVKVVVVLDWFREANHDFDMVLDDLTNASAGLVADSETDEVLVDYDGTYKKIRRTFSWTATKLTVATSSIRLVSTGALASAQEVYHGEKLVWLAF
jgi:hypothetical protein